MTRQDFTTADLIALEVQADDLVTTNLVRNGNPADGLGTYLWTSPKIDTSFEVIGARFRLTASAATARPNGIYEASYTLLAVGPDRWVSYSVEFVARSSAVGWRGQVRFYDAAGTEIGNATTGAWDGVHGRRSLLVLSPAGTACAAFSVNALNPGTGSWVEFTKVAARLAASGEDGTSIPQPLVYSEPYEWSDITGPTREITIPRAGFDLGSLTAVIRSAELDPATSTALRPGRLLRLRVLAPNGSWQSLFRGKIRTAPASYDYRQARPDRRNKITVTAVDPIAALGNAYRPYGVGTVAELAYLFEGADAPWSLNGSSTQPAGTPTYVTINPSASLADQVVITRDSHRAYAWCDRRGVVQVVDAAALPTTTRATLDAAVYSDAEIGFDTTQVINVVTVKVVSGDQTADYGPYVDQASVDTWGAYSASFTVQGLDENPFTIGATIAAYAAEILAANAQPSVRISSVRIPILTTGDLTTTGELRALLDLYDRVTVKAGTSTPDDEFAAYPDAYPAPYPTTLTQDALVSSIKHTITPKKWVVDIGLTSAGVAPLPQTVPTP